MAGIDNNTLLYLRGDSFKDLSPNGLSLNVVGNPLIENDSFRFNSTNKYIQIDSPILTFNSDFTIEYFIKFYDTHSYQPIFICGQAYNEIFDNSHYSNRLDFGGGVGGTGMYPPIQDAELELWYHFAVVRKNGVLTAYRNGVKFGSSFNSTFTPKRVLYGINRDPYYPNNWCNISLKNFRISNIARYTEDFTPPTQPYNSITINKTNQTDTNIEFGVTKLGQETINKVEVLVNGIVSETYTDNYDSINYLIDKELCVIGNNDITIRVTFDDIYTEELLLSYFYKPNPLPLETTLLDTVERVKVLSTLKQNEKTMLSSILTSKNVEVSEEDKMSDLIDKVDLLDEYDGGKLWLYKDGEGVSNISKTNITGVAPPTVNIQTNCIYISSNVSNSDRHISINTSNKIDLTKYSKFNVEYSCNIKAHNEGYNKFGLGAIEQVSFSGTNSWRDDSVVNLEIAPKKSDLVVEKNIATLNIGNVSNSYFIFVYYGMYNDSNNATIHKIWLEK